MTRRCMACMHLSHACRHGICPNVGIISRPRHACIRHPASVHLSHASVPCMHTFGRLRMCILPMHACIRCGPHAMLLVLSTPGSHGLGVQAYVRVRSQISTYVQLNSYSGRHWTLVPAWLHGVCVGRWACMAAWGLHGQMVLHGCLEVCMGRWACMAAWKLHGQTARMAAWVCMDRCAHMAAWGLHGQMGLHGCMGFAWADEPAWLHGVCMGRWACMAAWGLHGQMDMHGYMGFAWADGPTWLHGVTRTPRTVLRSTYVLYSRTFTFTVLIQVHVTLINPQSSTFIVPRACTSRGPCMPCKQMQRHNPKLLLVPYCKSARREASAPAIQLRGC